MHKPAIASLFFVVASSAAVSHKGFLLADKRSKVVEVEPPSVGFSLADMLKGHLPQVLGGLGGWSNVIEQVRAGKVPSKALDEMMSSSVTSQSFSNASEAVDPQFERSLQAPSVQEKLQSLINDPERLMKKLQNVSVIPSLGKANPILAGFAQHPEMLQSILKSLKEGSSIPALMQKLSGGNASLNHGAPSPVKETQNGWVEFESGIKLRSIRPGDGKHFPRPGDVASVQYSGYLMDGTKFDSSLDRGLFNFTVGSSEVIQGWDLGLRHLSLGERAILQVPSALAYGSSGVGPIPPDADLIFEIALCAIRVAKQL